MAKLTLHKPTTKIGPYKIVEFAGRDQRATLYLAEKDDHDFRYWLMEFAEPLSARPLNEGQDLFDWKGNSVFVMPVSSTTASSLLRFVQQLAWQFITPRFAKVAEEMAIRHDKNQLYQTRGNLSLENFFFNSDGTLSLYPAAKVSSSPIVPPEGNANLTTASDVYVVGSAIQTLLAVPPQEKPLLKQNHTLEAVLARATHPDPASRFPTAAGLALGLNGVMPSGIAADSAVEENSIPWMSGCIIPLIILLVLAGIAFGAYNAYQSGQVVQLQTTATARRTGNLVVPTAAAAPLLALSELNISPNPDGTIQASLLLTQNDEPLSTSTPTFTVIHNDQVVGDVQSQAVGGGRFTLNFATTLTPDNFFRVIAAVNNQNISGSAYVFNSDVTGINYETGDIGPAGLPRGPAIAEPLNVSSDGPAQTINPFEFPELFDIFRLDPKAEPTGLPYTGDIIIQVDSSGYPQMVTYLSFRNTAGFPARLGGKVNIKITQDGAPIPNFTIASVQPEEDPLTTAMMIDVSGSMEGEPMAQARLAAEEFVRQLRPTDSVCLYTFATQITLVQGCTTDHAAVITAIQSLQTVDDTSLYDALSRVATDQSALSGRQAIVVLSDGADTVSQATLEEALTAVNETNIPLYLIGLVSEQFDGTVLQRLANETDGIYLQTPSADQLRDLYLLTEVQLDNQYRLSFDSLSTDQEMGTLTFAFEDGGYQIEATKRFFVK